MAFLQLRSTNPNFSFLLKKNPASSLIAKELRKGVLFGYYSDAGQAFNAYFRDAFNEISYPEYKDQEFEYVNSTRYSSAQFVLNAVSELFRDAFKKRNEEQDPDDAYETILIINMLKLDNRRTLTAFTKHFAEDCNIQADEVTPKYYRVTLVTKKSLYYLLNLTNLFAAFTVIRNKTEYLPLDDVTVEKYFSALSVIDAPYFIRYHFKIELLRGDRKFEKYRNLLNTSARYPIEMVQGDTVQMRMDAVEKEVNFSNHLVDVGCGEGRYAWAFTRKMLKDKTYYAIDTNEECRATVTRKASFKELTNIQVFDSLDAFMRLINLLKQDSRRTEALAVEKFDFILGEVIEHMSLDEATDLVTKCLTFEQCNSVIITTPNADFNSYYFDEDKEMRHPDHHFEFTMVQFNDWVNSIKLNCHSVVITPIPFKRISLEVKMLDIGDKVNGTPVTLGAVLSPVRCV